MDIKTVKLGEVKPGFYQKEKPVKVFVITLGDGSVVNIPQNNPDHAAYRHVEEWYLAQKKKPFDFKFEAAPDLRDRDADALAANNDEDGSGISLNAEQTADAKLPAINLTREQRREIAEKQQK